MVLSVAIGTKWHFAPCNVRYVAVSSLLTGEVCLGTWSGVGPRVRQELVGLHGDRWFSSPNTGPPRPVVPRLTAIGGMTSSQQGHGRT